MNDSEKAPAQVLVAFIAAMYEWELFARTQSREKEDSRDERGTVRADLDALNAAYEASLDDIFAAYVTPTKSNNKANRRSSYRVPPDYDPKKESIESVMEKSGSQAVIRTRVINDHYENNEYVLVNQNGRWLVDRKYMLTNGERMCVWL